jgi:hypothetical protein
MDASFLSNPEDEIAEPIIKPAMINQTAVDAKPENKILVSINWNVATSAKKIKPVKNGGRNDVLQKANVINTTAALYENDAGWLAIGNKTSNNENTKTQNSAMVLKLKLTAIGAILVKYMVRCCAI